MRACVVGLPKWRHVCSVGNLTVPFPIEVSDLNQEAIFMNRRQALRLAALPLLLGAPALRAGSVETHDYSRDSYDKMIASGEPFLLDFYASW
jgi:hypothetical protein